MEHIEFGRRVAQRASAVITEAGLSQRAVAEKSGIALTTLNRKLAGQGKPLDSVELHGIAQAAGVKVAALIPDEEG